jgi:hypothetical protein
MTPYSLAYELCVGSTAVPACCDTDIGRNPDHLPFPTTNRDFVILIYTTETTPKATTPDEVVPRSFQVVSIPFDHEDAPERKGWCRGKYVSVEQVIEEGQEVVWT